MPKYTVLICDDNVAVHMSLTNFLNERKINVVSAYDGETALEKFRMSKIDLVILDIMLPGISGLDVCREIRKLSNVYILMLSAKEEELDRIIGLEIGADDYVTKPFSPREQAIRMEKILNRLNLEKDPKSLSMAELTIYPETYSVFVKGEKVILSRKEFDVLLFLMENSGQVLTREHIMNVAWGTEFYGDTRVIDSLIKRLRQKLSFSDVHFSIKTLYGVGYKIERQIFQMT